MSCDHPYHETSEEAVLITFTDTELYKSESNGAENLTPVRVETRYCTACDNIIDVSSFEDGFPLSRLNEIICLDEDCGHEFEFITQRTLTLRMADDTLPLEHNVEHDVTTCDNCKQIVDTADSLTRIPLLASK